MTTEVTPGFYSLVQVASSFASGLDRASLAAVANRVRDILALGEPEQTKPLLRLPIKELRVNVSASPRLRPPEAIKKFHGERNLAGCEVAE